MKSQRVYVVVFADLDEVPNGQLLVIAGHGADHQGVQLSCQLPHVLFVCAHQTLGNRKQVVGCKRHWHQPMKAEKRSEQSAHDLIVE